MVSPIYLQMQNKHLHDDLDKHLPSCCAFKQTDLNETRSATSSNVTRNLPQKRSNTRIYSHPQFAHKHLIRWNNKSLNLWTDDGGGGDWYKSPKVQVQRERDASSAFGMRKEMRASSIFQPTIRQMRQRFVWFAAPDPRLSVVAGQPDCVSFCLCAGFSAKANCPFDCAICRVWSDDDLAHSNHSKPVGALEPMIADEKELAFVVGIGAWPRRRLMVFVNTVE